MTEQPEQPKQLPSPEEMIATFQSDPDDAAFIPAMEIFETIQSLDKPEEDEIEISYDVLDEERRKREIMRMAELSDLSKQFLMELSRAIKTGEWHVTDVICKHVHYYLVSSADFNKAVKGGATKEKIQLYGAEGEPWLTDITAKRVGYLPHLAEPEPIPVFVLLCSPWMVHQGITADEITKKFTTKDMEQVKDAVETYQTRLISAFAIDRAKEAKSWRDIANQRTVSTKDQAEAILARLMMLKRMVDEQMGGLGHIKTTTRITGFIKRHKKAVGLFIIFLIIIGIILGIVYWRGLMMLPYAIGGGIS